MFSVFIRCCCPYNECSEVKRDNTLPQKALGYVARDNLLGETFNNSCFSNSGFTDNYRIIFNPSTQYLDETFYLIIPVYYRIKFPFSCQECQISSEFIKCPRCAPFLLCICMRSD